MYTGAARERGDKKRQRRAPLPNEVWIEAILNNGKKTETCPSASTAMGSGVAASSAVPWQGRATPDYSQASNISGPAPSEHYTGASNYLGIAAGRPLLYPARPLEGPSDHKGRIVLSACPEKLTDEAQGYAVRPVKNTSEYQATSVTNGGIYQERVIESSLTYQSRAVDGGYQGRIMEAPTEFQEKTADENAAYPRRLIYGSAPCEQPMMDGFSTRMPYQGQTKEAFSFGKMTEDYKRDKKLPPRVEEMLREQVNLDESVLHDAFAVAMEDLIPEKEANFVAKGLCHLCGSSENYFVPVVNFCPHADEHHSLCREHLRSVYRVRMEALFVGRNGSAPNRRLLRCLMCTRGCPCSKCIAERKQDVQKYKLYLLDTLRRSGEGSISTVKNDRPEAATSAKAAILDVTSEGRLTYGIPPATSSSDNDRYAQYPLTTALEPRHLLGVSNRSSESESLYERHKFGHTDESEYRKYAAEQMNRHEAISSSIQAQPKSLFPPVPKRASKDTSAAMHNVIANNIQTSNARVLARAALAPTLSQGFEESPSAATVLNCAESEKSLVQLLSSLNQGGTTASLTTMDASSQNHSHRQVDLRSGANESTATSEKSENVQSTGDMEMEASPKTYLGRNRRFQEARSYHEKFFTSSDESSGSLRRDAPSAKTQSVDKMPTRKLETSGIDASDQLAPRELASFDDDGVVQRKTSAGKAHFSDESRQIQSETRPKFDREKGNVHTVVEKETRSTTTPTATNRGSGRPRKPPSSGKLTPSTKKDAPKVISSTKKIKGRPSRRATRGSKDDEETKDETYDVEHNEKHVNDESVSDSELDANLDFCEVCQGAGDLVCCDKCPRSYHLKCIDMTDEDLPEGNWQCGECKKPSRFDAYLTAVASEETLYDKCLKIVACLKSHPFSKPFLAPVENVPMYTRVVKQPMDLSKIESKLKRGSYNVESNTEASGLDHTHFANDIRLMWSNCKLFNDDGSGITRAADVLSAGFERLYNELVEPSLSS